MSQSHATWAKLLKDSFQLKPELIHIKNEQNAI